MSTVVLEGKLTLDDSQFNATAKKSERTAASSGQTIGRGFRAGLQGFSRDISQFLISPIALAGSAIAGALSARAFASGIKGAIDMGSNMQKIQQSTNMAVGAQSMLNSMFKIGGEEAKDFGAEIQNMERLIVNASQRGGKSGANSIFSRLKIDIKELKQLSPDEQFRKIGAAINSIKDPVEKITASIRVFGEGGQRLIPVFDSLGKGNDLAAARERAELYKKNAEAFRQAEIAIDRFKLASTGLFVGVAEKVTPMITDIANAWSGYDWTAVGKKIGDGLNTGVKTAGGLFAGGSQTEQAASKIANTFWKGFMKVGEKGNQLIAFELEELQKIADNVGGNMYLGNNAAGQNILQSLRPGELAKGFRNGQATAAAMAGSKPGGATQYTVPGSSSQAGPSAPVDYLKPRTEAEKRRQPNLLGPMDFSSNTGSRMLLGGDTRPLRERVGMTGLAPGKDSGVGFSTFSGQPGQRTVSSFLSLSERRARENDLVASGQKRRGSTESAHSAVRSGDLARRKAFQAEQERGLNVQEQIARNTAIVAEAYKQ